MATTSRAVRELGRTRKKSLAASEQNERARNARRERLGGADPKKLMFVDESSTNVALATRCPGAPKGGRTRGKAPRNRGKNVTLISSVSPRRMGPSMTIDGPSEKESFPLYLREVLCPCSRRGRSR